MARNLPAATIAADDPRAADAARVVPQSAQIVKLGDCVVGYRHRPTTLRGRPLRSIGGLRLSEIGRLIWTRCNGPIKTDDAEWIAPIIVQHAADYEAARNWFCTFAPTVDDKTLDELMEVVARWPRKWTATELGRVFRLTAAERRDLDIRTIRAFDQSKAERDVERSERRNRRKREKRAATRAVKPRAAKPWEAAGISRATWFRRHKAARLKNGTHLYREIMGAKKQSHRSMQSTSKPQRRRHAVKMSREFFQPVQRVGSCVRAILAAIPRMQPTVLLC